MEGVGAGQADVDHLGQPLRRRGVLTELFANAHLRGMVVGILERLGQQQITRFEVVMDQRGRDAGLISDAGYAHAIGTLLRNTLNGRFENLIAHRHC